MSRALYRKYRPKNLSEVVGEDQVVQTLAKSLEQNSPSHAYIFVGPRGCGKTSVARIFAHEVNHFPYELEDEYVDIIEIDAASNTSVENIRDLREKAIIAPTKGKYKVYIIDEVHMLSKSAFNALLKILEEPPKHVIFIMATTDAYKIPVTITSRAQTYTFKLADQPTMVSHLKSICKNEKIHISDAALQIIAKRSGGSFRDALSLLDQISTLSTSQAEISEHDVISALGLPESDKITNLLKTLGSHDLTSISAVLKELLSTGIKPETIAEELINYIVQQPTPNTLSLLTALSEVRAPFAEAKLLVAIAPQSTTITNHPPQAPSTPQSTSTPPSTHAAPKPTPSPNTSSNPQSSDQFSWEQFLQQIKAQNDEALAAQLAKCTYQFNDQTLHIYPPKKFIFNILSRDNNKQILTSINPKYKIEIHQSAPKDSTITTISDIMGGEVQDGGENPF